MWASRDRNNELWLFNRKPKKFVEAGYWEPDEDDPYDCAILPKTLLPEVKWSGEPLEIDLVPKNKSIQTDVKPDNKKDVKADKQIITDEDLFI